MCTLYVLGDPTLVTTVLVPSENVHGQTEELILLDN